jgi:hypothetical protein
MNKMPFFPIGAVEVIVECQEILAGKREGLTPLEEYTAERRRNWQIQASTRRLRRPRAALPRRAA